MNFHKVELLRFSRIDFGRVSLFHTRLDEDPIDNLVTDVFGNAIVKWDHNNINLFRVYLKGIL